MVHEFRLPDLDLPGVPLMLSRWHVALGSRVTEGDRLVEILAGDAVIDLDAPVSGLFARKLVREGEEVTTGRLLGVIETAE